MPKVNFIEPDGTEHCFDAVPGTSVMSVAFDNGLPGIEADCGGMCACGTCHVYVDKDWMGWIAASTEEEQQMLAFAEGVEERSRLSCQITLTDQLDGLRVYIPESQH